MSKIVEATPLYSRLEGIVSLSFRQRRVFFGGLGAGSQGVEMIARCGPKRIAGVDNQNVEASNIPRTIYTLDDADGGVPKAAALGRRLRRVNPHVDVDLRTADLLALGEAELDELLDVDLIVAGTDSFDAQAFLNRQAIRRGIPIVFIGLHEQAAGGRIIWCVPGESACYRCVAPEAYAATADERELHGERACIIDSLLVEVIAMRVVLGILERGRPSVLGRFFDTIAGRNEIMVRADPWYGWGTGLWDAALADLSPKQAQELSDLTCCGDSLWLRNERNPRCPDCGVE